MTLVAKDGNGALQNIKTATVSAELVQEVKPTLGTTATRSTPISQTTTEGVLLASNANRISAKIYNNATAGDLYIGLGTATVSATDMTVAIAPGSYYEVSDFSGQIRGVWSAAGSGKANVTEITP